MYYYHGCALNDQTIIVMDVHQMTKLSCIKLELYIKLIMFKLIMHQGHIHIKLIMNFMHHSSITIIKYDFHVWHASYVHQFSVMSSRTTKLGATF